MQIKKVVFISLLLVLVLVVAMFGYEHLAEKFITDSYVNTDIRYTAPDFTVLDAEGNKVSLSDMKGKPVVVNFWATWCGPCRSELPHFEEMYKKYGNNVVFMMVDLTENYRETVEGAKSFINDLGYSFPLYFDTEFSAAYAYSVNSIPLTVFVKADGTMYSNYVGAISAETLEKYINGLLKKSN